MKKLKLFPVVLLMFVSSIAFAGGKSCEEKIKNKDILTQTQIEMKIQHCENLKPKREAFKATLTDEQKAIRKDKSLSKKERKEKLKTTYSSEQQKMKDGIRAIKKEQRKAFRATSNA